MTVDLDNPAFGAILRLGPARSLRCEWGLLMFGGE